MNHTKLKSFILSALLVTSVAYAGLYKGLDKEGNVVYSDKPFEDAEQMTPPPISVVDAQKVKAKKKVEPVAEEVETKYTRFSISAPKNQQTIWNEPDLYVKLQIKPALAVNEGHRTWLLMDGKSLVKNSTSTSLPIGRADRGEHSIQAQIRNKKGKIIKRTKAVTIHIKNTVVPRAN